MRPRLLAIPSTVVLIAASLVACGGNMTSLGSVDANAAADSSVSTKLDSGSSKPVEDTGEPKDGGSDTGSEACQADPSLAIAPCRPGEYCRSDIPGTCGPGRCTTKPPTPGVDCMGTECGCDGKLRCSWYSTSAGVDVGSTQCGVPCGTAGSCNGATEYCFHGTGGVVPGNTIYQCKPIPTACNNFYDRTCACLKANTGSDGTCTENGGKLDLDVPLP
jgi:hypothetical protein